MFDGHGNYEFRSPEEIERETAVYRRGALITICLLLIASFIGTYFLPSGM